MPRLVLLWILVPLCLLTGPARAEPDDRARRADEHWARGQALYAEGRYEPALIEFRLGRALDPRPEFLYAMGQAERQLGRCSEAIAHFRAYLAEVTSPTQREAADLQIARCTRAAGGSGAPADPDQTDGRGGGQPGPGDPGPARSEPGAATASSEPAPSAPSPEPGSARAGSPPGPAVDERRSAGAAGPWLRDPLGGALAASALVALAAGTVLLVARDEPDPLSQPDYGAYRDEVDRWQTRTWIGAASLGVGAALVAGAVLRYTLVARRAPAARLGATVTDGGALFELHATF